MLPRKQGADICYGQELIYSRFLRSISTELQSDSKFQLKGFLDDATVMEEILINKMNEVASADWERQSKLKKNTGHELTKVNKMRMEVGIHQQSHDNAEAVSKVQKYGTAAKNTKVRKVSVETS